MESFITRYRNPTILVIVLFAQVLGLAMQVKRPGESGSTRLLRLWVVNAVTPVEEALVSSGHAVRGVWTDYLYLRGVRHENRQLREEIERMRLEQVRLHEDAEQARRLQVLLGFKEQYISATVAAQVIGTSGSDLSRVFYIDKGASAGIKPDMAVITADGIVGKVLRVFTMSSQVLAINDPSSGVGAILEKTRLQGILQGTASGEIMMRYVMSDEKVEPGEPVLTSGGDRIFPKGLPIGTVIRAIPGSDLFLNIRVRPAANLSRIEEVLVVTKIVDKQPDVTMPAGPVRAADILAERLPSVPPKTADKAAGPKPSAGSTAVSPATGSKPATASTGAGSAKPGAAPAAAAASTASPSAAGAGAAGKPAGAKPAAAGTQAPTPTGTKPALAGATPAGPGSKPATTVHAAAPAGASVSAAAEKKNGAVTASTVKKPASAGSAQSRTKTAPALNGAAASGNGEKKAPPAEEEPAKAAPPSEPATPPADRPEPPPSAPPTTGEAVH